MPNIINLDVCYVMAAGYCLPYVLNISNQLVLLGVENYRLFALYTVTQLCTFAIESLELNYEVFFRNDGYYYPVNGGITTSYTLITFNASIVLSLFVKI